MKKVFTLVIALLLLSGCAADETYEVISDQQVAPIVTGKYRVSLTLPDGAVQETIQQETDTIYLCENYLLSVQTMEGGDLNRTVRQVTGFEKDAITMIQMERDKFKCWQFACSLAGEEGLQVCRGIIMDDGQMHHAVTVMADYRVNASLENEWEHILSTVTLVNTAQ